MTVIAIDGPSGSGKSTVAKALAARLGLAYLDTGAMYRAAALAAARAGLLDQPEALPGLVKGMALEISLAADGPAVRLDGEDVTEAIRSAAVSGSVSKLATVIPARRVLVDRQRAIVAAHRQPGIVVEGRDITTVVAPEADVRVLITASESARLRRRALERHGQADAAAMAATVDEVLRRDRDDSTVAEFVQAAPGVTLIDSSDLSIEQTVAAVLKLLPGA
ncbi:MAG: (d)CMP kinase [Bifidobacteriaceae bacterium]|jgi:cytidylate kinase|nr:(d)CMP kinase [Bifidobacteriaceae bacterium]